MKKISFLLIQVFVLATLGQSLFAQHNYAEVLQKSLFFYEAQQAGELPSWNRVSWRSDAAVKDGKDVNLDLSGGWFDAGDHVKFNFPMAYSVTTLCWGYLENKEAYATNGQKEIFLNNIKFVTDYFIKCHTSKYEFYGQIGEGGPDHSYWVPAEVIEINCPRPAAKIDAQNPGSDLAGETAAAFAAASMVFADEDPAYSATLLQHAYDMYDFADKYRGEYHKAIKDASGFYKSWSGYQDELVWAPIWLYKATKDEKYLDIAKEEYAKLANESQTDVKSYGWTLNWDDKSYGCYILMAQLTGEQEYKTDSERFLDQWLLDKSGSKGPKFTDAGFPVLSQWGSNRYAANTIFLMLEYSDCMTDIAKQTKYRERAKDIMDYLLGDNPQKTSYVIGYGDTYPLFPHHRSAHGSWERSETIPADTRHILYGALVGGHKEADDFNWVDDRHDYLWNEVACDYNSLLTGAAARLAADYGGEIDSNFPERETPSGEYYVEAKINGSGDEYTEYAVYAWNRTAWPARIPSLSFKLFVDISEGLEAGFTASDYIVKANGNSASYSQLTKWDDNIYYVEVKFNDDVLIFPGGKGECKEEAQIRIRLPYGTDASAWDPTNDWSYNNLTSGLKESSHIPLYANGELVFGKEPGPAVIVPVDGIALSPAEADVCVGKTTKLQAAVTPANASNKKVTFTSGDTSIATVSADGIVTAVAEGEAVITVTSEDGSYTASTTIKTEDCPIPVYNVTIGALVNGVIDITPAKEEYLEGDEIAIEAIADEGYHFLKWTGDFSGKENPKTVVVNSDLQIGAEFKENGSATCDDPESVDADFSFKGKGIHCWVITGDLHHINCWNLEKLEINGVDFTNKYAGKSNLPEKINGSYYISYESNVDWGEFHAVSSVSKSAIIEEELEKEDEVLIYPNPLSEGYLNVELGNNPNEIEQDKPGVALIVRNVLGEIVYNIMVETEKVELNKELFKNKGLYFIELKCEEYSKVRKVLVE